jgi:hypothetical protein
MDLEPDDALTDIKAHAGPGRDPEGCGFRESVLAGIRRQGELSGLPLKVTRSSHLAGRTRHPPSRRPLPGFL